MDACNVTDLLKDLFFVFVGGFALVLGIAAWRKPNSPFVQGLVGDRYPTRAEADPISRLMGWTREKAGPTNLNVWRILGPLNGTIFLIVGCHMTASWLRCRSIQLPDYRPLLGPLEFRFWPPTILFMAFAGVIGFMNSWKKGILIASVSILGAVLLAFAGGEAAGFHVGIQADRWGALAGIFAIVFWLIGFLPGAQNNSTEQLPDTASEPER